MDGLGDEAMFIRAIAALIDSLRRLRQSRVRPADQPKGASKDREASPDIMKSFDDVTDALMEVLVQMARMTAGLGAEQWRLKARIAELAGEGDDEIARCLSEADAIERARDANYQAKDD